MREAVSKEPVKLIVVVKALMAAYVMTAIMLLVLALMLLKLNLKQGSVEIGILIIYILATFAGGFLAGKWGKSRKFVWGMACGAAYVLILLLVSFGLDGGVQGEMGSCVTTLIMCTGAGMFGGMVS